MSFPLHFFLSLKYKFGFCSFVTQECIGWPIYHTISSNAHDFGCNFFKLAWWRYLCEWLMENILVRDFGCNYYQIGGNISVIDWWIIFWCEISVAIIIKLMTIFVWVIDGEYFGKRFWLQLLSDWWQYFCNWLVENILVRDFGFNYYQIDDVIYVSDWWQHSYQIGETLLWYSFSFSVSNSGLLSVRILIHLS